MANTAMEKALKQIEMTFSPERQAVNEKVLAVLRTVEMLNPTNDIKWRKKAWSNVEQYDILGVNKLISTIKSLIQTESELIDHEYIKGADTNVNQLKKSLEKLRF